MNDRCSPGFVIRVLSLRHKALRYKTWRLALASLVILLPLIAAGFVFSTAFKPAKADVSTSADDALRTGWYPAENNLTPDLVSGGTFGQLFSANVNGQVYAQPLISKGLLFIVTETNNIYGLDPATGAQKWMRNLGIPFNPADVSCSDLAPTIGITGTPVIDTTTNTAYFVAKTYVSGTSGAAAWYMHSVDLATGDEKGGFPVRIQGSAANDSTHVFNATKQLQRPGLLLMNGVVYAAFGGHCDRKPYEGWVAGVSISGVLQTLWTSEAGKPQIDSFGPGGGIWLPGGGLISDGSGQIIFSTGNGEVPPPSTPGKTPPGSLAQSVVRLTVQNDGSLKSTDFFAPYDADVLNNNDSDLGAASPIELPPQYFGTAAYPHLLIQDGKQGYVYLLNADNLGGRGQGPSNSDAVISRIGPNGGLWGKPGVWPGDGGYIYTTTAQGGGGSGKLKAYHYGLDGSGNPALSLTATSPDTFGFGSSSPVITSLGTTAGSALVWVIWSPDGTGIGSQLRAYDPIPVNGSLHLRYSVAIGTSSKFNSPAVANNRVYVGTRDGHVLGFGAPVSSPLTATTLDLGTVVVGKSAMRTLTIKANTNLTISALTIDNRVFSTGRSTPALPVALADGQSLQVPITFIPTSSGPAAAKVTVTSSSGNVNFSVSGTGEAAAGQISVAPVPVSFGGISAGGTPVTLTTTFTNIGASAITITGQTLPRAPFSISGLPAINSTLAPNTSVTASITFAPASVGSYADEFVLNTTGGDATVPISGTAGTPGKLTVSASSINLGDVPVGANGATTFTVSNTGGSSLNITRSKYPIAGFGFTAYSSLPEGTVLVPGGSFTETVLFSPTTIGNATDSWSINSDDGSGVKNIVFNGNGVAAIPNTTSPSLYVASKTLVQPTSGSTIVDVPVTLATVSSSTVSVKYTTKNGSASTSSGDYNATSGLLTFNPGETTKVIPVTVNARTTLGPEIAFTMNLSKPTNAVLGNTSTKIWLVQSRGLYSLYTGDPIVNALPSSPTSTDFPVSISPAPGPGEQVTVTVATADGTATAASDYTAIPAKTLTFGAGETTKNVTVKINAAPVRTGNKTFVLNLTSPSANANIANAQAIATIVNGQATPLTSVYISDVFLLRPTSGSAVANFTITLGTASTSPVTVNYATHDGSATVTGGYYLSTSGSVTFSPGEISKTVPVTIRGDVTHDSDVYFYLNLTGATNALLGDNAGRATLINQLGLYAVSVTDVIVVQDPSTSALAQVSLSLNAPVANGQTVMVQVSTTNGTAVSGTNGDYIALPTTVITLNSGQQTITVPIFINANTNIVGPKQFTLAAVKSSSNVLLPDTSAVITIISHG